MVKTVGCFIFRYRDQFNSVVHTRNNKSRDQNFLWLDFVLDDGRVIHKHNSIYSSSGTSYEHHVYNSSLINIISQDNYYWTRQFNYHIKINFENIKHLEYVQVRNTSDTYVINTRQTTIHYMSTYDTEFQHGMIYSAGLILSSFEIKATVVLTYITITLERNCSRKPDEFFILFIVHTHEWDSTAAYNVEDLLKFDGSSVFLMVTSPIFQVELTSFPACEVVFKFQLITKRITVEVKELCSDTFFKVKL